MLLPICFKINDNRLASHGMVVDSSLYDQLVNQMNVMVGICTPSSIVSTLTVAVAKLSVNKMKMIFGNVYTKLYIVSTLTVVVGMLSVNQVNVMVGNVYTKFSSVDTNGCSSNAKCKQAKRMVCNVYPKF